MDVSSSCTTLDTQTYVGACSLESAPDNHLHAVWSEKSSTVNTNSYNLSYTEGTNGGTTWILITALPGNPQTFDWVPTVKSTKTRCKVKVVLRDARGKVVGTDMSDFNFTIQP